LNLNGVWN